MNPKAFMGLLVVTVVAVIAAVTGMVNHYDNRMSVNVDAPVVPGLIDQVNDVGAVVIQNQHGTFTLQKGEGGKWSMPEKGGYGVRDDRVRQLLVDLAKLRLSEPKTRKPERFERLELRDVTQEGAQSVLVTLKTADGKALTSLLLGKRKYSVSGKGRVGIYLREPDENQAWFASGEVSLKPQAPDWLYKALMDIDNERISAVKIVSKEKGELALTKVSPSVKAFTIANLPEGRELDKTAAEKLKNLSDVFDVLDLDDVKEAKSLDFSNPDLTASVRTFDGLVLDVKGIKDGDKTWFTFAASVDLSAAQTQSADGAKDKDKKIDPVQEAKKINDRVSGWAYTLSKYRTNSLNVGLQELLKK